MHASDTNTIHPVVLIHGLFGWGLKSPLWNMFPNYWPIQELQLLNTNYHVVEVGTASSDHDRACEVFYQLFGGIVDYGEDHSKENDHEQFGTYFDRGLLEQWDENHPIHLIGYGSTTAIELYQMICLDRFGIGSNHKWILSITSIAGPLSGSTLSHAIGIKDDGSMRKHSVVHFISVCCGLLYRIQYAWPMLHGLYDFRMPQWRNHAKLSDLLSTKHRLATSGDNVYNALMPSNRVKRNATLEYMDKIYLISIVCKAREQVSRRTLWGLLGLALALSYDALRSCSKKVVKVPKIPWSLRIAVMLGVSFYVLKKFRKPDLAHLPVLSGLVWLLRGHTRKVGVLYDGFDTKMWLHNDGIVNTYSMICPRYPQLFERASSSSTDSLSDLVVAVTPTPSSLSSLEPHPRTITKSDSHLSMDLNVEQHGVESQIQRGQWYIHRIEKNHFCGTSGDNSASGLYASLFRLLNTLK